MDMGVTKLLLARPALDEPLVFQALERFPHGTLAGPHALRDLQLHEPLTGLDFSLDDGVAQIGPDLVHQRGDAT